MVEFFEDRFFQTVESETNDAERLDPKKRITLYIDTNIIITIYNSYNNDINNIIIIIMIIIIIIKLPAACGVDVLPRTSFVQE